MLLVCVLRDLARVCEVRWWPRMTRFYCLQDCCRLYRSSVSGSGKQNAPGSPQAGRCDLCLKDRRISIGIDRASRRTHRALGGASRTNLWIGGFCHRVCIGSANPAGIKHRATGSELHLTLCCTQQGRVIPVPSARLFVGRVAIRGTRPFFDLNLRALHQNHNATTL